MTQKNTNMAFPNIQRAICFPGALHKYNNKNEDCKLTLLHVGVLYAIQSLTKSIGIRKTNIKIFLEKAGHSPTHPQIKEIIDDLLRYDFINCNNRGGFDYYWLNSFGIVTLVLIDKESKSIRHNAWGKSA